MTLVPDLNLPMPRLMFITDPGRTVGRELPKVVELVLKGGCRMVQVRAPGLDDRAFYLLARQLTHLINAFGALSIINDRIDICHAVGAQGVHLGSNDLPLRVARQLLGPNKLLGYSAHTLKELRKVGAEGADYATFSPIYTMPHKDPRGEPWGPVGYREAKMTSEVPVFALGGITLERIPELLIDDAEEYGHSRIAVVSLLSEALKVKERTEDVLRMLHPDRSSDQAEAIEARYTFEPENLVDDREEGLDPHAGGSSAEDQDA